MLEPIPFAGMVEIDGEITCLEAIIVKLYGKNSENMPKYVVLGDGSVYIYHKEEDRHALREQTPPLQEGISATASSWGETNSECKGTSTLCDRQDERGQE